MAAQISYLLFLVVALFCALNADARSEFLEFLIYQYIICIAFYLSELFIAIILCFNKNNNYYL